MLFVLCVQLALRAPIASTAAAVLLSILVRVPTAYPTTLLAHTTWVALEQTLALKPLAHRARSASSELAVLG